ncbi:hypothetical protein AAH994_15800, partial [Weeksellaceae bacterium A-14]
APILLLTKCLISTLQSFHTLKKHDNGHKNHGHNPEFIKKDREFIKKLIYKFFDCGKVLSFNSCYKQVK